MSSIRWTRKFSTISPTRSCWLPNNIGEHVANSLELVALNVILHEDVEYGKNCMLTQLCQRSVPRVRIAVHTLEVVCAWYRFPSLYSVFKVHSLRLLSPCKCALGDMYGSWPDAISFCWEDISPVEVKRFELLAPCVQGRCSPAELYPRKCRG